MSRASIKAVDAYCEVLSCDEVLAAGYPDELERWTNRRDRALAKFRRALSETTYAEFISGRWGGAPMSERNEQWRRMQTRAGTK
jgi:hypothetical protein